MEIIQKQYKNTRTSRCSSDDWQRHEKIQLDWSELTENVTWQKQENSSKSQMLNIIFSTKDTTGLRDLPPALLYENEPQEEEDDDAAGRKQQLEQRKMWLWLHVTLITDDKNPMERSLLLTPNECYKIRGPCPEVTETEYCWSER